MQNLIEFFENETNKKINIFKYSNQKLKSNQKLVNFNNDIYVIDIQEKFIFDNPNGYFYIIYQQNLDFENLKRVLDNLYDDIEIFEYEKFALLNSSNELDINFSTPGIIESETYTNTLITYIGKINSIEIFNTRISIFKDVIPFLNNSSSVHKFINLNDLAIHKAITLISSEKSFCSLIDFQSIKTMDKNLLHTGISFIENDLNISKTSSYLFLHRNTLIYRLEKIKEILGLDIKTFKDAFIFYISIKSYFISKS
ncbi:PucR family transcriptional regulator [Romboutsia lituseburensis]|uniref:PucR family transcriptional regulator n=1 Tax=Romboutsia lituseburensis TaxID=1537 RepID=UPI00215B0AFE|nr:helix-turn-helix domain-containing protein [Romboutsia lituseburensis]MCR8744974.1 helix-turn-helix domain-containing protein [Romboutsia lituseburensis]